MIDDACVRAFRPEDLPQIRSIMEASLRTDAIPGFLASDIDRALVRVPADPDGTVVALEGDRIVGYCTPRHGDLTVHPDRRRCGHGRRLVAAATRILAERGDDELALHVPPHLPASRAFADALGFRYRSSLWQFELPTDGHVPAPMFPSDVTTRTWGASEDVDRWASFVNATFEGHPTPIRLTPEVVRRVNAEPRFDPEGLLIVAPVSDPDEPIGFARVEVLPDPGDPATGYVTLIGVLPAWRGRGIGRELLRWGVTYLRGKGVGPVQLSVEAANERATELYRRHGFVPSIEWPIWSLPTS
jgi:mycothiol synthase